MTSFGNHFELSIPQFRQKIMCTAGEDWSLESVSPEILRWSFEIDLDQIHEAILRSFENRGIEFGRVWSLTARSDNTLRTMKLLSHMGPRPTQTEFDFERDQSYVQRLWQNESFQYARCTTNRSDANPSLVAAGGWLPTFKVDPDEKGFAGANMPNEWLECKFLNRGQGPIGMLTLGIPKLEKDDLLGFRMLLMAAMALQPFIVSRKDLESAIAHDIKMCLATIIPVISPEYPPGHSVRNQLGIIAARCKCPLEDVQNAFGTRGDLKPELFFKELKVGATLDLTISLTNRVKTMALATEKLIAFRSIVAELLGNAANYQGTKAAIQLFIERGSLTALVWENSQGFSRVAFRNLIGTQVPRGQTVTGGYGLSSKIRNLKSLGGKLCPPRCDPEKGNSWKVSIPVS